MLLRIEKSHHWRYLTRKRTQLLRDVPVSWWSTGNALSSCSCADDNVISYRDRIWERKGERSCNLTAEEWDNLGRARTRCLSRLLDDVRGVFESECYIRMEKKVSSFCDQIDQGVAGWYSK